MIEIRKIQATDHEQVWDILQPIIAKGDSFAYPPLLSREEMMGYWCHAKKHTYVAVTDGKLTGTFFLQDNQPGHGSHIANAAYAVSEQHSGIGIGTYMGEYSLTAAKRLGYTAMQFNLVVKSNTAAVKLWKKIGFEIIGEIPDAFNHHKNGPTNAYIMYRKL